MDDMKRTERSNNLWPVTISTTYDTSNINVGIANTNKISL